MSQEARRSRGGEGRGGALPPQLPPCLVQAPSRLTTFRWWPMWVRILSSVIRALYSLAVAPSVWKAGTSQGGRTMGPFPPMAAFLPSTSVRAQQPPASFTSLRSAEGPSLQTVLLPPTLLSQHPFDYREAQSSGGVSQSLGLSSWWTQACSATC